MKAARYAYQAIQSRYQSGLIGYYDVIQSLQLLYQSEASVKITYWEAWKSLLTKAAYQGQYRCLFKSIRKMNIIQLLYGSLRKPVAIIVAVIAIIFFSVISIRNMPVDIFPKLGTPTIYVAQTYGGLSAEQLEGYITSYYEYHFLYVTGIKSVESKTIQGVTLLKLNFHEGTDMGQATGEVVAMVNRARAFMPPGTISPFVTRFDGGSVPVGQLVFSSTRSLSEVQDLALFKVRPMFSTLPGVSAPAALRREPREPCSLKPILINYAVTMLHPRTW
ncbi:efflux RND transporter permease subunit [Mucilaginibacter sp. UC70_90]